MGSAGVYAITRSALSLALLSMLGALWLASQRSQSTRLHNVLARLVPIFGFLHITGSLSPAPAC